MRLDPAELEPVKLDPAKLEPEIRPRATRLNVATYADAGTLAALYRGAWHGSRENETTLSGWLEEGGALYFTVDSETVCALRWRETPYGWEVGRVATLPAYRGQGLGRWLMTRLEALAIQHNIPELQLTLDDAQAELLPYYTRMGYRSAHPETPLTLAKRVGGVWQRQQAS